MKIGIAGGIGSGKSYVCALIRQRGFEVYDCDSAAKRLIRTDPDIRSRLTALIGPDTYTAEGQLNKAVVARFLLASDANADAIDAIVHPAVFRDFEASGLQWLESAIMYESGIYRNLRPEDFTVVADYNEIKRHPSEKCRITLKNVPQGISRARLDVTLVDYLIENE